MNVWGEGEEQERNEMPTWRQWEHRKGWRRQRNVAKDKRWKSVGFFFFCFFFNPPQQETMTLDAAACTWTQPRVCVCVCPRRVWTPLLSPVPGFHPWQSPSFTHDPRCSAPHSVWWGAQHVNNSSTLKAALFSLAISHLHVLHLAVVWAWGVAWLVHIVHIGFLRGPVMYKQKL